MRLWSIFLITLFWLISSASLRAFLNDYDQYQLHFIPTEVNLFEVLKYEPDIVVLDSEVNKVVKCYEWDLAA